MIEYKLPNAAAHRISVTGTAATLEALINTAAGSASNLPTTLNAWEIAPENGDVRYLSDGNTPTATEGNKVENGVILGRDGIPVKKVKLISTTGTVVCTVRVGWKEPS